MICWFLQFLLRRSQQTQLMSPEEFQLTSGRKQQQLLKPQLILSNNEIVLTLFRSTFLPFHAFVFFSSQLVLKFLRTSLWLHIQHMVIQWNTLVRGKTKLSICLPKNVLKAIIYTWKKIMNSNALEQKTCSLSVKDGILPNWMICFH